MRSPDRNELDFATVAFIVLAPMAYYLVRGLIAAFAG